MAVNYNTISAAASNDQPSKPTSVTVKKIAVLAAAISFTLTPTASPAMRTTQRTSKMRSAIRSIS